MPTIEACKPNFSGPKFTINSQYVQFDYDVDCKCSIGAPCMYNNCVWAQEIVLEQEADNGSWNQIAYSCNDKDQVCPSQQHWQAAASPSGGLPSGYTYKALVTMYGLSCANKGSVLYTASVQFTL